MRPKERRDSGQEGSLPRPSGPYRRHGPPAGQARRLGRLGVSRGTVRGGLFGQTGPPTAAHKADGGAFDPQAHARSLGRGAVRPLDGTLTFQLFCGEEFFQHRLTFDRSSLTRWRQRMGEEKLVALVQESLNVATRTGAARPADFSQDHRRYDGAAEGGGVPDRRQADASGARTAGPAGQEARRGLTPVLRAGRQIRADRPSALRPRQAVQAGEPSAQDLAHVSRPGDARYRSKDQGRHGVGERLLLIR